MNKTIKSKRQQLLTIFLVTMFFHPTLSYATPAGQDNVRIHIESPGPRKNGDTLFSVTGEWRKDENLSYLSKGMLFVKGPDKKNSPDSKKIAKNLVKAIKDGMVYLYPGWRGAVPKQTANEPIVTISNAQGFSFMFMTIKDYANQILTFDLVNNPFAAEGVDAAVDIVRASAVESLIGNRMLKQKGVTDETHSGEITIRVDQQSVTVKTDNKSPEQIEKEIAAGLSFGSLNSSPLYPNLRDGDERNTVPFDGHEVQFLHLAADSITTDINDRSLGVIVKLKFKDENKSHDIVDPPTMVFLGGLIILAYIGFQYYKTKQQNKLEDESHS